MYKDNYIRTSEYSKYQKYLPEKVLSYLTFDVSVDMTLLKLFIQLYTVKLLYSGHHRDLEKVSAIERCPLHRGSSQIYLFFINNTNFTLKTCFGFLGYCIVETIV